MSISKQLNKVVAISGEELLTIIDAMRSAHYRRQPYRGRWRVALWPPCNMYPQPMPGTPDDRRALMRYATGLRKLPSYATEISNSASLWREVVMMLSPVPNISEFDSIIIRTAEDSHAVFDAAYANLDLIGGCST